MSWFYLYYKVIEQRKAERLKIKEAQMTDQTSSELSAAVDAKRKGFLDLLLDSLENGSCLSDIDVRDETQTFIFGVSLTTY